ncbi:MAG: hypothetical protein KBD06_01920 [Candidatus Pacebacteria bacterium]|nr:hypothetical protein [Candidatus Paceibacterota bacterium]
MANVSLSNTFLTRAAGVIALVLIAAFAYNVVRPPSSSAEASAEAILQHCNTAASDHSPCYEAEVAQLYPTFSVPQIFDVIREIRAEDPSYQFCHVLAHKVGERVVAEDPDRWVDAIPLNPPSGYCSNGFIHGVVGGRFRAEVLSDETLKTFMHDFKRACEPRDDWHPSDLDKAICYHGMGHLYDFITNADLDRALGLCAETVPNEFRRVCVEGVFMQIFQPLEPDDFALIEQMKVKPTKDTVRQFCASYKDAEYVGACLRESWPMYQGMLDGTGAVEYCAGQPNAEHEDRCYQTVFSIIGRQMLAKPDVQLHACTIMPEERRQMCYSVIADTILEEDRGNASGALAFCDRAGGNYVDSCISYLIRAARFNFGSSQDQYSNFCAALPAARRSECGEALPRAGI